MKPNRSKSTPIKEFSDVCMNSLIIVSFVKIILIQRVFAFNNISFFVAILIFMILLLSKRISVILRAGVSIYALYLFFTELTEGSLLFNYTLSLLVAYFGFYIIFRKALLRKNIEVEVVSNCLALAIFVKLLYSYLSQVSRYSSSTGILTILVMIIIFLLIPVLEDLSRLVISLFATADILLSLYKISSLFTIVFLVVSIVIFGGLSYRLRIDLLRRNRI